MDSCDMVKISVIIAAYNCADTLGDAIKSVISQTVQSFEIIVCDDCSQDGTRDVIASYADQDARLRVLANTENCGPSYTRNRALDVAEGEWIAILDADDLFDENRLHTLLDVASETNADIIFDNMILLDERGRPIGKAISENRRQRFFSLSAVDFIRRDASLRFSYGYLKPMIRRSFLSSSHIRYRESVRFGEDFLLVLDCLAAGAEAVVANKPGYYYKISPGSLSRSSKVDYFAYFDRLNRTLLTEKQFVAHPAIKRALLDRQTYLSRVIAYGEIAASARQGYVVSATKKFFQTAPAALFYSRLLMRNLKVRLQKVVRKTAR